MCVTQRMRVCIIDSDGGSSASSSLSHSSLVLLHLWSPSHLLNLIASVAGANERGMATSRLGCAIFTLSHSHFGLHLPLHCDALALHFPGADLEASFSVGLNILMW